MVPSFENILIIAVTLIAALIAYYKWTYQYWKRKNVPYLEPKIPFGNLQRKENHGLTLKRHYDEIRSKGWKHAGIYMALSPNYLVADLQYLKNIMTKDFASFVDRGFYYNEKADPLSAHLFAIGGEKWRHLRTKLTPTFTSGKMKMMFQTLLDCVPKFLEKIQMDCQNQTPIDIKEMLGRFTTDIIGSCAFGLQCNTFDDEDSPFRRYSRKLFTSTKFRAVRRLFTTNFPDLARALGMVQLPPDIAKFFFDMVKDTVDHREKNNYTRKDFMQLLIDLKNKPPGEDGRALTIEEVAAQSFLFFIAGFETSSTTMTFVLYELSRRSDLQGKVRKEIETVLAKHDGKITYEAIQEMKYMEQVINEALRMYPPVPFLTRKCGKDYKVPGEDVIIDKGTTVMIPILGIHYDKEYYPEPLKFDPERFSEENKSKRHNYAHIPFGEGPRVCIGMRFGLMQVKVGLTALLKNYKFTVNNKTLEPLKMKNTSFILTAEGDIWLNAEKV